MRAAVLDFGGVITRTLFETHPQTERALGLPPGSLRWRGPFDPVSDPLWCAMQAGEISERAYWMTRTRETGALIGRKWTAMSDFLTAARGDAPRTVIRPEFRSFVARARAGGVRLAILSNELDLFYGPGFRGKLDFLPLFDAIHDATYTGILKPDPRAYRAVTDDLGLAPADCVFIDDQKRNIGGAAAVGMVPVHLDVTNPQGGYGKALRLLGLA